MGTEIKMPQLGESVVEGTITKWLKKEGDSVDEDELLVEVSTDKVDSEVPSSASGTIQKILVQEGETVKVGTAIAVVGEGAAESDGAGDEKPAQAEAAAEAEEPTGGGGDGGDGPRAEAEESQAEADEEPQAEVEEEQEGDARPEGDGGDAGEEPGEEEPAATAGDGGSEEEAASQPARKAASDGGDTSKRGIISPLVRRLADEHGVDLDEIDGTGTGGRIRKQDVLKYVESGKGGERSRPAASAEPAPEPEERAPEREERAEPPRPAAEGREELVPWTNIRRRTAEHMAASARETARAWNVVEADWTNIVKLRTRVKEAFGEREGFNITYLPFLARAVCDTLLEMPEVNASFDEDNQANRVKHYVNLGIAVALEGGGLIVPVVKGADERNLVGLARGINDVVTRARAKKLSPDDLTGGSFTITNPGPFGSIMSVPVIPRGQAAILGFEAIEKRVVVTADDSLAIRSRGFLSLSWDHRVIDGAEAARFLAGLKERIETTDYSSDLAQYS
ncbi:MAG TPA: dihydrolipoamide acetyltransferase family protein [Actinomycetota bacterium]|nr:dihydrolipoamide acetyltransferase family protein [Actinomycetota bacterium]